MFDLRCQQENVHVGGGDRRPSIPVSCLYGAGRGTTRHPQASHCAQQALNVAACLLDPFTVHGKYLHRSSLTAKVFCSSGKR